MGFLFFLFAVLVWGGVAAVAVGGPAGAGNLFPVIVIGYGLLFGLPIVGYIAIASLISRLAGPNTRLLAFGGMLFVGFGGLLCFPLINPSRTSDGSLTYEYRPFLELVVFPTLVVLALYLAREFWTDPLKAEPANQTMDDVSASSSPGELRSPPSPTRGEGSKKSV